MNHYIIHPLVLANEMMGTLEVWMSLEYGTSGGICVQFQ